MYILASDLYKKRDKKYLLTSFYCIFSARTAAIYYFISGLFLLLACFDTYFALPLNVINIILFNFFFVSFYPLLVNKDKYIVPNK